MKLFNKKPEDTFTKLDRLMKEMASKEIYNEYLKLRKGMQELKSPAPQYPVLVKCLRCDLNHPEWI